MHILLLYNFYMYTNTHGYNIVYIIYIIYNYYTRVCVSVCLKSSRITCLIGPPSAALWLLCMSSTTQLERARFTVDKFYERAKQLGQMYRI